MTTRSTHTRPHTPTRRSLAVVVSAVVVSVVGATVGSVPMAGASPGYVSVDRTAIGRPIDYFTTLWSDAMDFDNAGDFDTSGRMAPAGSVAMANGQLQVNGVAQLFLLRGEPGSLPASATRDPRSRPLDGRRFNRISMRMYSDRSAAAAFGFRTNAGGGDGAKYFMIQQGWHTYDLDMLGHDDLEEVPGGAPPVSGASWADEVTMLWMSPGFNVGAKPNLVFDDFSIHEPAGVVGVQLSGSSGPTQVWIDGDGDNNNNGASTSPTASATYVGTYPANAHVNIPVGNFAGGTSTFQVLAVQGGTSRSAVVSWANTAVPRPRIVSPSELGGGDFATDVRGDAWDMSQPSDVALTANIGTSFTNGELRGWPSGRNNDPVVVFNQGDRAIDASLFHKLAITINYEGPFGLEDAPGGGMVSRVIWETAGSSTQQVSYPIVMVPGRHTYVIDLRTEPREQVVDPDSGGARIGWGGGEALFVKNLRFDPHEDPGDRAWQIDDVRLLRDEVASGGYTVDFADDAWVPGATADVYADFDRLTTNGLGTLIAGNVGMVAGTNRVAWSGAGVPPGSYWIHLVVHHGGAAANTVSTGQVATGVFPGEAPLLSNVAQPSGPSQAQLIAFFNYIITTKFLCGVARARNIAWFGTAPICRLLLGPWSPPKTKRARR